MKILLDKIYLQYQKKHNKRKQKIKKRSLTILSFKKIVSENVLRHIDYF